MRKMTVVYYRLQREKQLLTSAKRTTRWYAPRIQIGCSTPGVVMCHWISPLQLFTCVTLSHTEWMPAPSVVPKILDLFTSYRPVIKQMPFILYPCVKQIRTLPILVEKAGDEHQVSKMKRGNPLVH